MKVLMTGNLGYIGPVMSRLLKDRGHEVWGLDTGFFRECWLGPAANDVATRQITKDVRDISMEDVQGADAIIHLAALSNDPMGELNPGLTEDVNFKASVRLAELGKQAGVSRFLFASSCSIYGAGASEALTEEDAFNPLTAYARSKVDTEHALGQMADDRFSPTFMRNATVYGGSPRLRFDLVVNNLTGWAVTTGQVKLLSDGRAWRPMLHVEDMSQAFLLALEAPREDVHNQALNVGIETDNYMIRQMADAVAEIVPGCQVTYAEGAAADNRNYNVNFEKIRKVLPDFQPQWNVPKGIEQIYRACVDNDLQYDDFAGRNYTRLKQLQFLLDTSQVDSDLRWIGVPDSVLSQA